jgi:hypothetical protein
MMRKTRSGGRLRDADELTLAQALRGAGGMCHPMTIGVR